jgi:hypothetical protein
MSETWIELDGQSRKEVWDRFYRDFVFHPSIDRQWWPGIREPVPSETYSISEVYGGNEAHYARLNRDLQDWGVRSLKALLPSDGEWVYALDWQHPCYRFYPNRPFALDTFGEWPVPILPNGDYYIFLHPNFDWGIFGHPWEQTMCVFGERLLSVLCSDRAALLTCLVRRNGGPVPPA